MNAIFKHAPWDRQQIRRTNERRFYNEEEMDYSDTNGGRYGGALRLWWKQRHFGAGDTTGAKTETETTTAKAETSGADGQRGAEGRDYQRSSGK